MGFFLTYISKDIYGKLQQIYINFQIITFSTFEICLANTCIKIQVKKLD